MLRHLASCCLAAQPLPRTGATSVLMQSSDVCGPVPQGLPPSVGSAVGAPSITPPVLGIPKVRILGAAFKLLCFALPSARYRAVPARTFTIPYFPSSLIPYISSYLRLLLICPLAFPFSFLGSTSLLFMAINPNPLTLSQPGQSQSERASHRAGKQDTLKSLELRLKPSIRPASQAS